MDTVEQPGKLIEVGKLLAGVIVVSMLVGVATAGYSELPDRVGVIEMAHGSMLTNMQTMEDRIEAVERTQADIKKELQLITCLQLAEAKQLFYQDCLQ
jgi:Tfp pilus assembly protein PilE